MFEIKVVKKDGEKLFKTEDGELNILFNKLTSNDDLDGTSLEIIRKDGLVKAEVKIIYTQSHPGPEGLFFGLPYNIAGDSCGEPDKEILAEQLELGDKIIINSPNLPANSFAEYLANTHDLLQAFSNAMPEVGGSIPIEDLQKNMDAELAQQVEKPLPTILRF